VQPAQRRPMDDATFGSGILERTWEWVRLVAQTQRRA
jgi:hypothetical protein